MQKRVTYGDVVTMIKDLFEKEIGLKNLSFVELNGDTIEFGIHSMRFMLMITDLTVYRIKDNSAGIDDGSLIIQRRLREHMIKSLEA